MLTDNPTLKLAKELIKKPSVTPKDCDLQTLIAERLAPLGFKSQTLPSNNVENIWLEKQSTTPGPRFVFAGHTDVVPTGDIHQWDSPPFEPTIKEGFLYGRGAADMKGSIAAMICAIEKFIESHNQFNGSIALLLTSDEEGPATDGTVKVVEWLEEKKIPIDYCLVGEPSSSERLGDIVRNGRRGSLSCELTIIGKQGHVAYPHLADNPIHKGLPVLTELSNITWDNGNDHFPATSFQIVDIKGGVNATNVIPEVMTLFCNWRYSTELDEKKIKQRFTEILDKHLSNYKTNWSHSGPPFLTAEGKLLQATQSAISSITGTMPELSTGGGTSDGRFIAKLGCEIIELGPINKTIHQINECVSTKDLTNLTEIYYQILKNLMV